MIFLKHEKAKTIKNLIFSGDLFFEKDQVLHIHVIFVFLLFC